MPRRGENGLTHTHPLDPIPEGRVDTRDDLTPERFAELQTKIQGLEADNNALMLERDSAVDVASWFMGRLDELRVLLSIRVGEHNKKLKAK